MHDFPSVFSSIEDLSKEQIDSLLVLARKYKNSSNESKRFLGKTPAIATLFLENSTRTKLSFQLAAERLGLISLDFNAQTSSLSKGEDFEQTFLTLAAQGFDAVVIRTGEDNFFDSFKRNPPIKLINAGDGKAQHPTQALLDLFTFKELGFEVNGKTFCICGDTRFSRVVNSLCDTILLYGGKVILSGPKEILGEHLLTKNGISYEESFDQAIENSQCIYMLRVQKERHGSQKSDLNTNSYNQNYGINQERINKHKKLFFHPGPVNIGVEIDGQAINSPYYMGYQQVENSLFMRMAILETILTNADKEVSIATKRELPPITL